MKHKTRAAREVQLALVVASGEPAFIQRSSTCLTEVCFAPHGVGMLAVEQDAIDTDLTAPVHGHDENIARLDVPERQIGALFALDAARRAIATEHGRYQALVYDLG